MERLGSRAQRLACLVLLTFLPSCAAEVNLDRTNFDQLSPLKVGRQKTPEISDLPAGALAGFLILGSAGVGFASAIAMEATKREPPIDFGELVMKTFVERVPNDIPGWPPMTVEDELLEEDHLPESGPLLEFKVDQLLLHFIHGLVTKVTASIKTPSGDVLWQKSFIYSSGDFDRKRSIDEFKADENKLLKQEFKFAVDKTVSDFIGHLKGEQRASSDGEPASDS